jgi:hypothetical protein
MLIVFGMWFYYCYKVVLSKYIFWYNDPHIAYMNNVFMDTRTYWMGHQIWWHMNGSLIGYIWIIIIFILLYNTSITMHWHYFQTLLYVPITWVLFQKIIYDVHRHCFEATTKVSDDLEKRFMHKMWWILWVWFTHKIL